MPTSRRRHITVFKGVMIAHRPVVTDETTSAGWIGWIAAKMIPATIADKPAQRISFGAVILMLLFLGCLTWSRLLPPAQAKAEGLIGGSGPEPEGAQEAILRLQRAFTYRYRAWFFYLTPWHDNYKDGMD